MSFTKEKLEHTSSILSQHLVCGDSYCTKISDPFTNRVICRCYQNPSTSASHLTSNFSASFFHSPIPGEIPSPVISPSQPNPAMRWDTGVLPTGMGYGAPYTTMATAQHNIDNILRSQMYSYMHVGLDHNNGRRKNATRETTAALKAWLKEHKKNPYPTKAEKIMLAIITRMTLTQVSTWFANARRRLKKEHKGEFSSDTSFDNISTSSDDEDSNSKSEPPYKTDNMFNNEAATPEHELPGYRSMTSADIYNFASFTFPSGNRPLTSTPIDHNMNNLPEIVKEENEEERTSDTLKYENNVSTKSTEENNTTSCSEDIDSTDSTPREDNRAAVRPMFLPPLISKPKIWSITNIIGNDNKGDHSNDNER